MASPDSEPSVYKTRHIAAELDCSEWKVLQVAKAIGVGMDLGGRAGFRFTHADKEAIYNALRPAKPAPVSKRRKRRSAA